MRRLLLSVSAAVVALAVVAPLRADDEARKVVDKALKAHGGAETLAKFKDKAAIVKGKMKIHQPIELDATMEMSAGGKKFKQDLQFSLMGMDFMQSVVYDGKELWVSQNGKIVTTLSKEDDLKALKETIYAEELAEMALLGDKKLELSLIGEDKVSDVPVVGVRVSSKGHKDVSLYFDKTTGLLLKMESRGFEFQTQQEVGEERIFGDYKDFEGRKRPTKVTMNREGKKFIEMEITDVKIVDKLDDSTFSKP
jgi:outer membrane lipoprotein-sorting protein